MIDRQGGKIIFECDSCDETFDGGDGEEFSVVWNAAKREGWKSRKVREEWVHGCARCGV